MSDIVSAFKQNTRRKRANYQDEQQPKELDALSALQQKRQQNTVEQESNTNTALESSQRQNVQLGNNTSESQKLAQLQQLAAQEQAQNAANAAAAQQKQQEQQQQRTQQVQPKDNDGWKKYYDKEKQIVREQAFKSDGFGSWLQDVFNSGWDSRLAEQRARDKYANEMINQSFNDDGSVKDANKLNEVKQFTAQNMNVAKQYGDYERARGNAIGANLTSDKHNNPFKATANAVRNMDIGNAILGSNDPEGTEGSKYNTARDVGKFLTNLVPGMLSAPITGLTNMSEAISGKGTDKQTGLEKELDNLSRVGKGIAGGIDVAGVFFGGSKEALTRVSDALFRKGAEKAVKETSKGVIKNVLDSMIKEGAEEATQQAAEFFGNGGKLVTKDGQFDDDSFKELLAESGKAGALGAVGRGLMNVGGRGVARLINNSQARTNTQQGINSNINNNLIAREQAQENLRQKEQQAVEQPVTEDVRKTENVNEDVSKDTQEDTAERTQVQEEVKETSNTQYEQDVRNSLNDAYRNMSKTITPENKANLDAEMKQLSDMRNTMPIDKYAQKAQEVLDKYSQTTAEQVVEPKTESVTGQSVNPQDISKVTAPTVGTQASETPANVKTDVTENNAVYDTEDTDGLTKAYNRYAKRYEDALNSGDKEAISKARDNYNLALKTVAGEDTAQYDVDKGVVVNQVLAEEMYNNGVDGPAANTLHANMFDITDGKPLAHDYTTGEDLYFLDDINNALKRDGYKDAMGNQFKTFAQITKERDNANRQAFQQAIEESIAKSETVRPTADMINDIGYDRNISFDDFEQSRYDYYRSQDPDFKEYDDATINQWVERDWEILQSENDSQTNIDQTFDDRVANEYGRQEMDGEVYSGEPTAETELNDLIDTARNKAPEPIPMEAYGVEPEMEQTPAQQPTTQNETVTTESVANIDNLPDRVGNITENYLTEDNYTIDQMRDLSNRINTVAEREANALGTTMENIRREVNRAERAGLSRLDQTELTDAQQDLYRRYLNELNTIRGFAESQGKQIAGDIGELYLPNQMLGWEDNYKPLEGFNTQRPGSEIARGENRIDVEEQDFGTDPIDRYFIEHGASDAVKQQHASEAVSDITGNAEPKPESIKEYIKLQEDINNIVVKNPLKLTQKSGKEPISPSNVINKIGTDNGTQQQPIYGKARGLTDEDKLTSVEVPSVESPTGKVSVFEAGGYFAYRQAPSYAADVMNRSKTENGFNSATLRNTANEYIDRFNLSKNDAEHFKNRIDNLSQYLSDKAAEKTLEFIFRDAARTQNVGFLSSHNASGDHKLQQVIDRQSTIMLRDNSIEKSAATKMTNGILKAQNAAFRKMNVSSAINELSDLSSMLSVTGRNFRPMFKRGIAAKYGMSEAEIDPAVMAEISSADGTVDQSKLKTYIKKIGRNADKYTNLYHFVEQYKLNIALTSFENMGTNQGLSGKELVDFVTSNTRKVILPVDQFTHTFLNDYPLFTQYMPWTLRNIQKEGKLLTGSYDGGVYQTGGTLSKSRLARVAYNAVTNLPLKTVYWLASNALKGTALATAFGLLELGGDYSGIDDKDKNWYEKYLTQVTGASTIGSLINSVEYALHKEGLKNQYADSEYNSYENEDLGSSLGDIALTHFVPAGSQIKKTTQEAQVLGQGYSKNKAGKVQYLDSDNPLDAIKGLLFGKSSTDNAREYSGNLDVIARIQNKLDEGSDMFSAIVSSITDMAKEDLNIQDREYNRPLSNLEQNNYSQKVKNTTGQEQKDWYEKGRAYNAITDTLRRENPDAYEVYESTFSKEIVSPERYARIAYGNGDKNPESIDLTVWNTMKDLANKRHDDFGTPIDPAYTQLDDEQTRRYLAYRATATGEDVLLKKDMCLDPFWDSFFDEQNDYYNKIGNRDFDDSEYSARVQEWNYLNDQYGDYQKFISGNIDTMKDQQLAFELSLQFQLMTEYQKLKTALKDKYGDEYKDSQEYKTFWSQNYDAYQEESDAFNQRMLDIINQMRRIEGFDDMTIDQLEAINGFGKGSSKKSYGKSSGKSSGKSYGGSDYSYAPKFENIFQADPLYAKEYGGFRPVKPNLAGNPNFENVGFSGTAGKEPYAQV